MNISEDFLINDENHEEWRKALNFIYADFTKIVEMTENAYWHFLECVPPKIQERNCYLSGEAYTHNSKGEGVYLSAIEKNNKFYAQMGTIKDFRERKLFK